MFSFNVTNIANLDREIYLWHRVGKKLCMFRDKDFYPYYYQLNPKGAYRTIDGKKVNKIICKHPSDVKNKRDVNSWEADILYCKRYIIDKIDSFGKAELKYSFIDIEVMSKELPNYLNPVYPISCISCSNSYTKEIKTFFLLDYQNKVIIEEKEKQLLSDFVKWIRQEQLDLLLGWNFIAFDWAYLTARYKKIFGNELAKVLSPISQMKVIRDFQQVKNILIPAGLSISDYLNFYKKVYRAEFSYSLDAVCQKHLNINRTEYKKMNFNDLSQDIRKKNIDDIRCMIMLEEKLKLIDYYDELRRMSMCEWNDVTWTSKILDMMLLKESQRRKIILPSKCYTDEKEEEISFEGAYRRCEPGIYKGLWKLDLASAYPSVLINFCLDIANIKDKEGININGVRFYQDENALLPSITKKLLSKKDILKEQLKNMKLNTEETKNLEIKYSAIKAVVNSIYGVCALKSFRLFDIRIASAITFLVRDLLRYVENKLEEQGIKVIYLDTDSIIVDSKTNPVELCNNLIKQWAKEKYGKNKINIKFELEGKFENLFIVALCRYKGYLSTSKGIKEEIKGLEIKRTDTSNFTREFQNALIEKVMNRESKESIVNWINSEKERIKTLSLEDIGFPAKITKQDKEYKIMITNTRGTKYLRKLPIHIQAKNNSIQIFGKFDKQVGDNYLWLYYDDFKNKKEIFPLAFDKDTINLIDRNKISWDKMIERSITNKVKVIFEALKWNLPSTTTEHTFTLFDTNQ